MRHSRAICLEYFGKDGRFYEFERLCQNQSDSLFISSYMYNSSLLHIIVNRTGFFHLMLMTIDDIDCKIVSYNNKNAIFTKSHDIYVTVSYNLNLDSYKYFPLIKYSRIPHAHFWSARYYVLRGILRKVLRSSPSRLLELTTQQSRKFPWPSRFRKLWSQKTRSTISALSHTSARQGRSYSSMLLPTIV